ncbi:uncharacterized protein L199_008551 [Kwoniella botswanensis]|uniref:uncharacterized protein n=1 Tax=Kwoniella botswanensis TaxID=1268659 RepID=UPI00315CEFA0
MSKFPSSSSTAPSSPLQPTVTQAITSSSPSRLALNINLKRSSSNALDLDRSSKKSTSNLYRDSSIRGTVKNHLPTKNKSNSLESLLPPSKALLTTRPESSTRVIPKPQRKAFTDAKSKLMKELFQKDDNKAGIRDVSWKVSSQPSPSPVDSASTFSLSVLPSTSRRSSIFQTSFTPASASSSTNKAQSRSKTTTTAHTSLSAQPVQPTSHPKSSQSALHTRQPVTSSPPLSASRYAPLQRLPKETYQSTSSYLSSYPVHKPHSRPVQLTPGTVSYQQPSPPPAPAQAPPPKHLDCQPGGPHSYLPGTTTRLTMAGHRGIDEPTDGSVVPLRMSHVSPKKRSRGKNKSKSTPSIPLVPMESPSFSLSRAAPQPVRPVEDVDSLRRDNELLRQSLKSLRIKFLEKNKQLTKERSAHHETSLSLIHEKEASKMNRGLIESMKRRENEYRIHITGLMTKDLQRTQLEDKYRVLESKCQTQKEALDTYGKHTSQLSETLKKAKGQIEYLKERNNEKFRELMMKNDELANSRTVSIVTEVAKEVVAECHRKGK